MPKAYSGRLAFDPETNFHIDPDGKPVMTEDGGLTWVYVDDVDNTPTHMERYHQIFADVNPTANVDNPEPHHFEVQPDDPHYDGVRSDPDVIAEKITSHTDASKASAEADKAEAGES